MASKLQLKRSSELGKVPQPADLDYGEIAINYSDGKLFYKKPDDSIGEIQGGSEIQPASDTTLGGIKTSTDFDMTSESQLKISLIAQLKQQILFSDF
jgi:hypothetical protein